VPGEAELLEGGEGAVEQEPGGDGVGGLRIALDPSAAHGCDQLQRPGEGLRGHTLAPVAPPDVEAGDAPVGQVPDPGPLVLLVILDPGQFLGGPELAPADAEVVFEDEGVVGGPGDDPEAFPLPVGRGVDGAAHSLGMEPEAPAPARVAVAAPGQLCERLPGGLVQRSDG